MRIRQRGRCLIPAVVAGLALSLQAIAQEPPDEDVDELESAVEEAVEDAVEDDSAVEEIIVVAPRPGTRRVPEEYEDPVRARLLRELYLSREDQAELARMAAEAEDNEGRIRFGYDPTRDQPTLEEDLQLPQRETTRPATIFTIEF